MASEAPGLAEELQALRQEMGLLSRQLSALADEHKRLAAMVHQTLPQRQQAKGAEHPPGAPVHEVLAKCGQDILRVLREVGRPLTTLEILDEMVHRHLSWPESTVSHTLAEMIAQGLIRESSDAGPRRHGLVQKG